jgi:hypothetical protein
LIFVCIHHIRVISLTCGKVLGAAGPHLFNIARRSRFDRLKALSVAEGRPIHLDVP